MSEQRDIVLSPAQRHAFDRLLSGISAADVLVLKGRAGAGKTTVLRHLNFTVGGELLGMRQFMDSLGSREPVAVEEAFLSIVEQALIRSETVMVDDLHLVTRIVRGRGYQRMYLLDAALTVLMGEVGFHKKLVFALDGDPPWPVNRRAYTWEITEFTK